MLVFEFSNLLILLFWSCLIITLNFWGVLKKKSFFNFFSLIVSVALLIVHVAFGKEYFISHSKKMIADFVFLIVSISTYLYVNDIETRRKMITKVFENKYKKKEEKK